MTEKDEILTLIEAAAVLKVVPETLRRAFRRGELKGAKFGRVIRISRRDLEVYYRAHGGGSAFSETQPEAATK